MSALATSKTKRGEQASRLRKRHSPWLQFLNPPWLAVWSVLIIQASGKADPHAIMRIEEAPNENVQATTADPIWLPPILVHRAAIGRSYFVHRCKSERSVCPLLRNRGALVCSRRPSLNQLRAHPLFPAV